MTTRPHLKPSARGGVPEPFVGNALDGTVQVIGVDISTRRPRRIGLKETMMPDGTSAQRTPMVTRRTFLTRAVATAGAVVGSVVMGVPTIWAQKLRDITLLQVGGSYSAIIDIARQATKDLGFSTTTRLRKVV
jgi:hypothetical protein